MCIFLVNVFAAFSLNIVLDVGIIFCCGTIWQVADDLNYMLIIFVPYENAEKMNLMVLVLISGIHRWLKVIFARG